jgi:hypothetical protein
MSIEKVRPRLFEDGLIYNTNKPSANNNAATDSAQLNTARSMISKIFLAEYDPDEAFHAAIVDCVSLEKLREKVSAQKNNQKLSYVEKNIDEISSIFWGSFFRDLLIDFDAFLEKEDSLKPLRVLIDTCCLLYEVTIISLMLQLDDKKDPRETTSSQSDNLLNVQNKFMLGTLEGLAIGKSTLFPFHAKDHVVCLEICRNEHDYDVVVYNTGFGLGSHSEATKTGSPHRGYYYPVMYRGVRKDQLPEFVRNLLFLQLGRDMNAQPNSNGTHLHNTPIDQIQALYRFLRSISSQVCREPPKDHPLLAYKKQSFGTCKFSCIRAWLRQAIFRQKDGAKIYREFNAFRLEKILQRISSAIAAKKGKERLSNETRNIISEIATASLEKRRLKIHNPSWPKYTKRLGFLQRISALIALIFHFLQHQGFLLISRITRKPIYKTPSPISITL